MEKLSLILFTCFTFPASIIPLIIGIIILIVSRKDKLIILVGLFTLKPVLESFISFLMMSKGIGYIYGTVGVIVFGMLPPIIFSSILLFAFRQTINQVGMTSIIMFGLDAIRWLISAIFPWWFGISGDGFAPIWYLALGIQVLFPSIYAVIALAIVINRKKILSKSQPLVVNSLY
jgi:hypothetical protein